MRGIVRRQINRTDEERRLVHSRNSQVEASGPPYIGQRNNCLQFLLPKDSTTVKIVALSAKRLQPRALGFRALGLRVSRV